MLTTQEIYGKLRDLGLFTDITQFDKWLKEECMKCLYRPVCPVLSVVLELWNGNKLEDEMVVKALLHALPPISLDTPKIRKCRFFLAKNRFKQEVQND